MVTEICDCFYKALLLTKHGDDSQGMTVIIIAFLSFRHLIGSLVRGLCSLFHCLDYPSPTAFSSLSTGRLGNLYFNIHFADHHYFYFECTCHKSYLKLHEVRHHVATINKLSDIS